MAYDKHTWTCHEPITADKLNHIEDGIANAGGDCDCGYECTETVTTLTEETVTTTAQGDVNRGTLSYSEFINAEKIRVTFNGTEYECERITISEEPDLSVYNYGYGGMSPGSVMPDFSKYPFAINSHMGKTKMNRLYTETAGTYTIKIEVVETTVTTTPCFEKARGYSCGEKMEMLAEESVTTTVEEGAAAAFGTFSYSQLIDADTIVVTFDGVEYECSRTTEDDTHFYGASYKGSTGYDWSEYPFEIASSTKFGNELGTETAGTHTVKIEASEVSATITPCFEKAVVAVFDSLPNAFVAEYAKVPVRIPSNLSSTSIAANGSGTLSFNTTEAKPSAWAVVRDIILPDSLVIQSIEYQSQAIELKVRNVTANAVTVTSSDASIQVVDFIDAGEVCAVVGTNCSYKPTPK